MLGISLQKQMPNIKDKVEEPNAFCVAKAPVSIGSPRDNKVSEYDRIDVGEVTKLIPCEWTQSSIVGSRPVNTLARSTTVGSLEDETVMASHAPCPTLDTFVLANASIGAPESPNSSKPRKSRNARRREKRKEKRRIELASTGSGIVSCKFASTIVARQQIC